MNNNLYHWHDEQMVRHKMQEVDRTVRQARLLNEAGLTGPGLLARAAKALRNWLAARRERMQAPPLPAPESHRSRRKPLRDSCRSTD